MGRKKILWRENNTRAFVVSKKIKGKQVYVLTIETKGKKTPDLQLRYRSLARALEKANRRRRMVRARNV